VLSERETLSFPASPKMEMSNLNQTRVGEQGTSHLVVQL